MAEPIRNDEPLTTGDIAGRRGDYAGNPNLAAEAQNQNPRGPQLVQDDRASEELRNDAVNNSPEGSREWDGNRPVPDPANSNPGNNTGPLFNDLEINDFRSRWGTVQTEFVDDPRRAVQEADQLVASVMQRLADGFAKERDSLEKQWDSGDNVSTEDLRVALQRYRAFFGRLLNAA
ncbi:MAG: hypothetical protein JOZ83_08045 [Silvibacterium sp.]|nr:hypothetical protein [Silvibacterium sp.]